MALATQTKRVYTDKQNDAFMVRKGINPHTFLLASMGHRASIDYIKRYYQALARHEADNATK